MNKHSVSATSTRSFPAGQPRIELGQIVATPAALALLNNLDQSALDYLGRHAQGDWGDVFADDAKSNERALVTGERLLSAYAVGSQRIWIVTEAIGPDGHRASTCVMTPECY